MGQLERCTSNDKLAKCTHTPLGAPSILEAERTPDGSLADSPTSEPARGLYPPPSPDLLGNRLPDAAAARGWMREELIECSIRCNLICTRSEFVWGLRNVRHPEPTVIVA